MSSFILETGLIIGLSINPNYKNSDRQYSYLMAEKTFQNSLYLKGYNETNMSSLKTKETKLQIEFGYKSEMKEYGQFKAGLGHNFEHETWSISGYNKDFDYVNISYKIEY